MISVYNRNLVTQTIVGDASGPHLGWDNPGGPDEQIAVSRSYTDIADGDFAGLRETRTSASGCPWPSRPCRPGWFG